MQTQLDIQHPGADPGVPATALTSTSIYALLAGAVAAGIDLLDALEASREDLEDCEREGVDVDLEPALGAPERHPIVPHPAYHRYGEHATRGPQDDQTEWAAGDRAADGDDREGPDEDLESSLAGYYGDDSDLEQDDADRDVDLGATTAINQNHAWRATATEGRGCDIEPSLGWSDGRGHPQAAMRGYDDDREDNADDAPQINGDEHDGNNGGDLEAEGGGMLPCLNQTVEGESGAFAALVREQAAMHAAATRLTVIVANVRARTYA